MQSLSTIAAAPARWQFPANLRNFERRGPLPVPLADTRHPASVEVGRVEQAILLDDSARDPVQFAVANITSAAQMMAENS